MARTLTAVGVKQALAAVAKPGDALFLQRFFKTAAGQYGEGDIFIGVRVPQTRKVCSQFAGLSLPELQKLLDSPVHEHRLAAVLILTAHYAKADEASKQTVYDFYLKNVQQDRINNWDIVDSSAEFIIGEHLLNRPRKLLLKLAASPSVWQRRVAVLSTFAFIKHGDASATLELARLLLHDPHDLIQKAVGWMLREVGKRVEEKLLIEFLDTYAQIMPRTMLRYAIEHLSAEQRQHFMLKKALDRLQ
jgi:3-methyladenine DNA glycosylase AlkD